MMRALIAALALLLLLAADPARAHGGAPHARQPEAGLPAPPLAGLVAGFGQTVRAAAVPASRPPCHGLARGEPCCCASACLAFIVPMNQPTPPGLNVGRWRAPPGRIWRAIAHLPPLPPPRG